MTKMHIIQLFLAGLGIFLALFILRKVRKKRFSEKESLLWILSSLIIFILSIFPGIPLKLSGLLGITYGPTLLFLMSIVWIFFILLRKEEQISIVQEKLKELSQNNAIMDEKIRLLESKIKKESNNTAN